MKAAFIILPFISLLIASLGSAVGSSFPSVVWIKYVGLLVAAALIGLWVYLDKDNFKRKFSKRSLKYGASSGLIVVLGFAALFAFGNLTSRARFNKQIDLTRSSVNTLSAKTDKFLSRLVENNAAIKVEGFFQDDVIQDKFKSLIGLYAGKGVNIQAEYIDPRSNPDRAISSKITAANTAVFILGDRESRVTTFTEEKITNALLNIFKEGSKTIYFITGHGEPMLRNEDGDGFGLAVTVLEGQKYNVKEHSILENAEIPEDADLVVFVGAKYDLNQKEAVIIDSYLKKGGAFLAAVDAVVAVPNLNEILNKYNLNIENDILILSPNDIRAQMFGQNFTIINDFDEMSGVTKDLAAGAGGQATELMVPFVRTITTTEENNSLTSLVAAKTSDTMVKISDVEKEEDLKDLSEDRMEAGSFGVLGVSSGALMTTPSKDSDNDEKSVETRVVAFGSSHFMNNQGLQLSGANADLLGGMIAFLTRDKDFISIPSKKVISGEIELSSGTSQLLLLFLSFIYPFAFLGGGVVYWLKRRSL